MSYIFVIAVIIFAVKLILKGYKTEPVLLLAGLILMAASGLFGWGEILPAGVASTNAKLFDPFAYVQWLMSKQVAVLGLMIMSLVGFAEYMTHIGADEVIVRQTVKPLAKIKNKSVLIFLAYMIGATLQLAIPSATALAVLLMVTLFPIMIGLGISRGASAAVIASTMATTFTPLGVDSIRASQALNLDLMTYLIQYQAPTSIVATIGIGLTHTFWQARMDRKEINQDKEHDLPQDTSEKILAPTSYFILPLLPIVFSVIFSPLVISTIKLDVTSIVFICMFISMLFEGVRQKSFKNVLNGFSVFIKGMSNAFSGVVFLLVSAGVFAYGIQSTGAINSMIEVAKHMGMPFIGLTFLFCIVVGVASVVMGSGNAAFLSFVEIIPTVAHSMGANPVSMILPIQQVSAMGRAASPVAACVIVSASAAKLSTIDVVKRTSVPVLVGFAINFIAVMVFI